MSLNSTIPLVTSTVETNTIIVLKVLLERFVNHLPLLFVILGLVGSTGNALTYVRVDLRSNTCCIYLLCGSIMDAIVLCFNTLPTYLSLRYGAYIPWRRIPNLCKLNIFMLAFLPHLSINFLLMSIIDRYTCTCKLASPMRRLNKRKMIPWSISITIILSCLAALRTLLFDYQIGLGCVARHPLVNNILYFVVQVLMQPMLMLVFVLLTVRNVRLSRQRVVSSFVLSGTK